MKMKSEHVETESLIIDSRRENWTAVPVSEMAVFEIRWLKVQFEMSIIAGFWIVEECFRVWSYQKRMKDINNKINEAKREEKIQ